MSGNAVQQLNPDRRRRQKPGHARMLSARWTDELVEKARVWLLARPNPGHVERNLRIIQLIRSDVVTYREIGERFGMRGDSIKRINDRWWAAANGERYLG